MLAGLHGAGEASALTEATADQRSEEVLVGGIAPAGEGLIVGQFRLHPLKLLLSDNRWNLGDGNPLLAGGEGGRVMRAAQGMGGRAANTCPV
jgi:hypothetical protein